MSDDSCRVVARLAVISQSHNKTDIISHNNIRTITHIKYNSERAVLRIENTHNSKRKKQVDHIISLFQRELFGQHPNMLQLLDTWWQPDPLTDKGMFYMVVPHAPLGDIYFKNQRVYPNVALAIIRDTCRALEYLQERGLMHRDVKPQNLLASDAGNGDLCIKLADFDLVCETIHSEIACAVHGTPNYISPRIAKHYLINTRPSIDDPFGYDDDAWSTGVTLYSLAVGRAPYKREKINELCQYVAGLYGELHDNGSNRSGVGEDVWAVLSILLRPDRHRRATIHEVLALQSIKDVAPSRINDIHPDALLPHCEPYGQPYNMGAALHGNCIT